MCRGLGRWERAIWRMINDQKNKEPNRHPQADTWDVEHGIPLDRPAVHIIPWYLCVDSRDCWDLNDRSKFIPPTAAELEAARRAMHSFVRKFPQYGLISSKGRASGVYLYERDDPVSVMWANLSSKYRSGASKNDARLALRHLQERRNEPFKLHTGSYTIAACTRLPGNRCERGSKGWQI